VRGGGAEIAALDQGRSQSALGGIPRDASAIDPGTDNDDIATAEREAAEVLDANPDLRGYLCCDAAGPIGIARAIRKAGKAGQVAFVGMDAIRPILEFVKEGVIDRVDLCHEAALFDIESRYGDVEPVSDVLRYLNEVKV
jgi:hypothetical protein